MMRTTRGCLYSALLLGLCLNTLTTAARGADDAPAGPEAATVDPDVLRAEAAETDQARQAAAQRLATASSGLAGLQDQLLNLRRELAEARKQHESMQPLLKQRQEESQQAAAMKQDAQAQHAAAEQALVEAQAKADAARRASAEATAKAETAAGQLSETVQTLQTLMAKLESLQQQTDRLTAEADATGQQIAAADAEVQELTRVWVGRRQRLEDVLRESGEWVSFAAEVAPILSARCIACHDARTAKGKLNLGSYAALMKGGESGAIVESGNGADSLICVMVDDGSMPQDADPLTGEQIALVRRWVELGAQLDAGVDAAAPLIRIMPKLPQPAAPEVYPSPMPVTAVAFSPDGTQFATSGYHEVLLWNAADGSLVRRIGNIAERVHDLEFHPDGRRLAVAAGAPGQMGELKLLDVAEGTILADLVTVEDAVLASTFSPDGSKLAAAGADRSIRVFDVDSSRQEFVIEDHADWVMGIAFSPDGTRLASASRDKTAKLFDASSGDALLTFNGHGEIVYGVRILADGKRVVTCGRDQKLRIWDTEKAEEQRSMGGFAGDVFQLALLPDDQLLACSADHSVRQFNLADGNQIRSFEGHADWVYAVDVHPASRRVLTGSYDGEVRMWNLDDGGADVQDGGVSGVVNA